VSGIFTLEIIRIW